MRRIIFTTALLLTSPAAAAEALGWDSVPALLRQRYAERSPERQARTAAELQASAAGGLRLDPVLASTLTRDPDAKRSQLASTLTQGTPFGTELQLAHGRSDLRPAADAGATDTGAVRTTTGVRLSQQLLKGGPVHGLELDRAIARERDRGLLAADVAFDTALYEAMAAFLGAQEAQSRLAAARSALAGAEEQHTSVTDLVQAGFKAKADLLVSEAAVLRARIALDQAAQRTEAAQRALELALLQRPGDPPLSVAAEPAGEAQLARLEAVAWPDETPAVRAARLEAEAADARAAVARRDALPALAASVGMERSERPGEASETTRTVGLSLTVPLGSVVTREGARLAAIRAQAQTETLAQARQAAVAEREDLTTRARVAREAFAVAGRLHEMSLKTLEIEQQKYADGKSTINELRRVQDDVDQAALGVIGARKEMLLSRLALARAAGGLQGALP